MPDLYRNYDELSAHQKEWEDYKIESYRSSVSDILIAMPHWWFIEPGSTEVWTAIAKFWNHSWYSFSGCMRRNNYALHITSNNFDEPLFTQLTEGMRRIIWVHWYWFYWWEIHDNVIIWWWDETLRDILIQKLQTAWYDALDFTKSTPFKGQWASNVCNRWKKPGIQIELSQAFRRRLLRNESQMEDFAQNINDTIST